MKLKGKLIEFMIVHDLVPMRIRWRKSANGIGRMFNDVFHMLDKNERIKLTKMMHSWGLEDAGEVVETLKIERNLHGCAIALIGMHRVFGIKSHIVGENANEVKIRATKSLSEKSIMACVKVTIGRRTFRIGSYSVDLNFIGSRT